LHLPDPWAKVFILEERFPLHLPHPWGNLSILGELLGLPRPWGNLSILGERFLWIFPVLGVISPSLEKGSFGFARSLGESLHPWRKVFFAVTAQEKRKLFALYKKESTSSLFVS
jgi:hypothetical protein